jgi:hypothetical protein
LQSASRIKLEVWPCDFRLISNVSLAVQSRSRTFAPDEVLIYEFETYVCRQVLFIGCGWFFNLHKQSACSGE